MSRLVPLLCLALAACGGGGGAPSPGQGRSAAVECAPFARALTGVDLTGAAADWWAEARGRYTRSQRPDTGSLLILRRSARLPSGHVAVVSQVVSRRQIMVTQANWVHHRVTEDQPVIDISTDGDWSAVRVWWPPSGQMGVTEYAAFGFIRPDHPAGHDRLIAAVPSAIRVAEQGW
nr:CHAP domain-containing protein [uncultured Rhodopila sp.]